MHIDSSRDEIHGEQTSKAKTKTGSLSVSFGGDRVSYDDALEQTGHGRFNYLATGTCSVIFIHSLLEMVAIAYIITPVECDLQLTVKQLSLINSAVFIGIMSTAIFWGVLGDKYGRRRIMLPTILGTVMASFASSLCTRFWMMFLLRFLTGCLVSATSPMVLVYLAELQDGAHRDRCISYVITSAQMSFLIVPAIAWALIPRIFSIHSWRIFMWLWGLVGLMGAVCLFFLPESPAYVMASKGPVKTLPILALMYAKNFQKDPSQFPVRAIAATNVDARPSLLQNLLQMMKAPIRRYILLSHFCFFLVFLLANGLYIWLPDFLNAALSRPKRNINMCGVIHERYSKAKKKNDEFVSLYHVSSMAVPNPDTDCKKGLNWMIYPISIGMELFYLIPFITVIFIINKYKKPWLYAIIMWIAAAGLVLCLLPQCMVAIGFLVLGLACGSCRCILTALAVGAFPTNLRGLATCTMYMAGQLGAVVGTSLVGLLSSWYCYIIFPLLAIISAGSGLALICLWPNMSKVRTEMKRKLAY